MKTKKAKRHQHMSTDKSQLFHEAAITTHPQDPRVLMIKPKNLQQLELIQKEGYQGAVVPHILTPEMREELNNVPDEIWNNAHTQISIFTDNQLTPSMRAKPLFEEAPKTIALLQTISCLLNDKNTSDTLVFVIAQNLSSVLPGGGKFHLDGDVEPLYQSKHAILSLDLGETERLPQTEWLATDGLTEQEIRNAIGTDIPKDEHHLKKHIQTAYSGDFLVLTGLSDSKSNPKKYGVLHRGVKRPMQRRISFLWGQFMNKPTP